MKNAVSNYGDAFSEVVAMAIYGYHFRKLFWSPKFPVKLEEWLSGLTL